MKNKLIKFSIIFTIMLTTYTIVNTPSTAFASVKEKVIINKKSISIYKGKSYQLSAVVKNGRKSNKQIIWSTSNKKIATVSKTGKVKALSAGTVTIKARSRKNKKVYAQCKVYVILNDTNKLDFTSMSSFHIKINDCTVRSYNQLKKCIQQLEETHADTYEYYEVKKYLSQFNEEYFDKNVLYVKTYVHSDGRGLYAEKIERIKKSNGKYKMRIIISDYYYGKDVDHTANRSTSLVFVKADKNYSKSIQNVEFKFVTKN